jgi:hypothetical protein
MAQVDPFVVPIPKKLLEDPETRHFFEYFVRWAHDMAEYVGVDDDTIGNVSSESNRKADTLLTAVLDRVSLGYPLTSDTDGFTVDSTILYADMDES